MRKRLVCALLSFMLMFSLLPANMLAYADPGNTPPDNNESGVEDATNDGTSGNSDAGDNSNEPITDDNTGAALPAPGETDDGDESANEEPDGTGDTSDATDDDATPEDEESTDPEEEAEPYDTPLPQGQYIIRSALSNTQVIDIAGGSMANGANVQLYGSNMTPAQLFDFTYDEDGFYTITNVASQKVLDVYGGIAEAGTNVWQYEPNGSDAQKWVLAKDDEDGSYTITSALRPNLVLEVLGANTANSANIWIYGANGTRAQKFYMMHSSAENIPQSNAEIADGRYYLKSSIDTSFAIDMPAASTAEGSQIQIYGFNRSSAQTFEVKKVADEDGYYYTISPMSSPLMLCVRGGNVMATTPIVQSTNPTPDSDKFAITKNADDTYTFINKKSGLAIDVIGGAAASGTKLHAYTANSTPAQSFMLERASDDPLSSLVPLSSQSGSVINLVPYTQLGNCFDVAGASRSAGANIQSYPANFTLAQKFEAKRIDDGKYTFQNVNSGMYLTASSGNVVQQATAADGPNDNQIWFVEWAHGGMKLTSAAGQTLTLNGSNIGVSEADDSAAQVFRWQYTRTLPMGMYQIYTQGGKYIDETNGSTENGTNIQIMAPSGGTEPSDGPAQKWTLFDLFGGDYFAISCVRSKRVLDVTGGSTANATNVWLYNHTGSGAQFWKAIPSGDGWFYLQSYLGENIYMATSGDGRGNAENIQITSNPSYAQKFRFNPTTYVPPKKYSGTYIDIDINDQWVMFVKDGDLIVETEVITGAPWSRTPIGTYRIINKMRNVVLRGDDYALRVEFWMPFTYQGHGLHDAWWRSDSTFGGNTWRSAGSHGCVNMPYAAASEMYYNLDVGTVVYIHW